MDDVVYGSLLYRRGDRVEVYQGYLNSTKQNICIKLLYCNSISEANDLIQETYSMMRFKDVPDIIKIIKSDLAQAENKIFVRVLMDYFPNGDLNKLINSRLPNNYWTEPELLTYLTQITEVFALLESRNVAHRDIKPENIFVSNDNSRLIVGDLGSAKEMHEEFSKSIAGTPLYLSPELRLAFIEHLKGTNLANFQHNPFKSDVYSLGLTFLYMASLKDSSDMMKLNDIEQKVASKINELKYSLKFKDILKKMMSFNPEERYSFQQLKDYLISFNPQITYKKQKSLQSLQPVNNLHRPADYGYQSANLVPQSADYGYPSANLVPQSADYGYQSANLVPQSADYGYQSANLVPQSANYGYQSANLVPQSAGYGYQSANPVPQQYNSITQPYNSLFQQGYEHRLSQASTINKTCIVCKRAGNFQLIGYRYVCQNCINKHEKYYWDFNNLCLKCDGIIVDKVCSRCKEITRCQYCKFEVHFGSCFENQSLYIPCLICYKEMGSVSPDCIGLINGYYAHCIKNVNHYYCIVCNRGAGFSHTLCALLIQGHNNIT